MFKIIQMYYNLNLSDPKLLNSNKRNSKYAEIKNGK